MKQHIFVNQIFNYNCRPVQNYVLFVKNSNNNSCIYINLKYKHIFIYDKHTHIILFKVHALNILLNYILV